jgi:hypothetical protein
MFELNLCNEIKDQICLTAERKIIRLLVYSKKRR